MNILQRRISIFEWAFTIISGILILYACMGNGFFSKKCDCFDESDLKKLFGIDEEDEEEVMPQKESPRKLTKKEKKQIEKEIEDGYKRMMH